MRTLPEGCHCKPGGELSPGPNLLVVDLGLQASRITRTPLSAVSTTQSAVFYDGNVARVRPADGKFYRKLVKFEALTFFSGSKINCNK